MDDIKNNKPTIGAEDITVMRNFFKHFKIDIPVSVEKAWTAFEKEPTCENQEMVRAEVATAIVKDSVGVFTDKVFAPLRQESEKNAYYDHFKDHLEELLNDDIKEEPKD